MRQERKYEIIKINKISIPKINLFNPIIIRKIRKIEGQTMPPGSARTQPKNGKYIIIDKIANIIIFLLSGFRNCLRLVMKIIHIDMSETETNFFINIINISHINF